jgi:hypothetical protein
MKALFVLFAVVLAGCSSLDTITPNESTPMSDAELAGLNVWWSNASAMERFQVCEEYEALSGGGRERLAAATGFTDTFQFVFFMNTVCD